MMKDLKAGNCYNNNLDTSHFLQSCAQINFWPFFISPEKRNKYRKKHECMPLE